MVDNLNLCIVALTSSFAALITAFIAIYKIHVNNGKTL